MWCLLFFTKSGLEFRFKEKMMRMIREKVQIISNHCISPFPGPNCPYEKLSICLEVWEDDLGLTISLSGC